MPSILFHEIIADKFVKKHKVYDTNEFYLGTIVPDAVNAYGFASKESRWSAHKRDSDLNIWQNNIINFLNQNIKNYEKDYILGYIVHVLTDIYCDEIYQKKFYPELLKKGYNYDSAYEYYRIEIEKFENSKLDDNWWQEIIKKWDKSKKEEINGIDTKMIQDWIKYTVNKYNERQYEENDFIQEDFANNVLKRTEEILQKNNII